MSKKLLSLDLFGDWKDFSVPQDEDSRQEHDRLLRLLRQAVQNELTARQAHCVRMYYFENKKQAQIGKELGITEATVSRHIKKARSRLFHALRYAPRWM